MSAENANILEQLKKQGEQTGQLIALVGQVIDIAKDNRDRLGAVESRIETLESTVYTLEGKVDTALRVLRQLHPSTPIT